MPRGAAAKGPPAARSRSGMARPAPAATPCPPDSGTARTEFPGFSAVRMNAADREAVPPFRQAAYRRPCGLRQPPRSNRRGKAAASSRLCRGKPGREAVRPGHTRRSRFAIPRRKMPQEPPRGFRSGEIGLSVIRLTACSFPAVRASAPRRPRFPRHRASRAGGERRPCVTGSTGRRRRDGRKSRRPLPPHICPPDGIGCTGRPAAQTGVRPGGGRKDGA